MRVDPVNVGVNCGQPKGSSRTLLDICLLAVWTWTVHEKRGLGPLGSGSINRINTDAYLPLEPARPFGKISSDMVYMPAQVWTEKVLTMESPVVALWTSCAGRSHRRFVMVEV